MRSFQQLVSLLVVLFSLLIGASAFAKEGESTANINLAFVTDLSGSMKTNNLVDPTREFLVEFTDELLVGDRVIMVNFGTEIGVNSPSNISERNRQNDIDALHAVIDGYQFSENYTYTSGALLTACNALKKQSGPAVLVLLSDGKEEIPPGSDAKWDQLSSACSGNAIHVVALTAASKPTLDRVGKQLGATVHDATQKSLAEIGNEIRKGIRVFVESDNAQIELGNVKLGEAGEIRATFRVTGASSSIELTPSGDFPEGAQFTCSAFTAPGDVRCSLTVTESLTPGAYTGKVSFTPSQGNLAVVTPTIEVKFSRGLTNVTVSEDDISLGALRPGETQVIRIDFEADDTATPQPITLSLTGLPDGMVTLEPSRVMVPAADVELKFTFVNGNPGDYSGQLTLTASSPTMQVSPAVIPLSFHRRTWYWENWMFTLPGTVLALLFVIGVYFRKVVIPRREAALKPYLKGRIEYLDGRSIALDSKLQEQEIDGFKFRATGTSQKLTLQMVPNMRCKVRRMRGGNITLMPNVAHNLKDGDQFQTPEGEALFTFRCLGL